MATITTEGGVFTLGYEALDPDGKPAHFQSCYSPRGAVIYDRKQDVRPESEIYMEGIYRRRKQPPSETRAGIYRTRVLPDFLAFIDKLDAEEAVFLNWRRAPFGEYTRIAIGLPYFYTSPPNPWPLVSEILFHEGVLAVAWVRPTESAHELVFSKLHVDDPTGRRDEVLVPKLPFITMVSAANIGAETIVVGGRGIRDDSDTRQIVRFTRMDLAA